GEFVLIMKLLLNTDTVKIVLAIVIPTLTTAGGGLASFYTLKARVEETSARLQDMKEAAAATASQVAKLDEEREAHALQLNSIEHKLDTVQESVDRLDSYLRMAPPPVRRPYYPDHSGP